jgi:mycothiol system anti-sigma-R factor
MSDIKEIGCEEALRRMFEYLDRELDGARHAEMEQHLHTCRACFSRAEFERRLKGKLGTAGNEPAPPEFEYRIKNLLRRF